MPKRIAVIDLGTNTFHILIAEFNSSARWQTLYRERIFVNLASDGIERLSEAAMERGYEAMRHFHAVSTGHAVQSVVAVGTAALRKAENAGVFLAEVATQTGIHVEVISGEREAALIGKGVLAALPPLAQPILIMDIGGGSVEMLLVKVGHVLFAASYPVGVAVLYGDFHDTEPVSQSTLQNIDHHLDHIFVGLHGHLQQIGTEAVLVGASGTFDVIDAIVNTQTAGIAEYTVARPSDFYTIYEEIIALDLDSRLAHPAIPDTRARYIVVAMQLIHYMLRYTDKTRFYISSYAMKEGLMVEASGEG